MDFHTRPVFRDGERLTAARLNRALDQLRDSARRTLVGPLSPGVALGLALRYDPTSASLEVSSGVAIDRRGRLIVVPAALRFALADIETATGGPLSEGSTVRIGIGLDDVPAPRDACAPAGPREVREHPVVRFRRLSSGGETATMTIPLFGAFPALAYLSPFVHFFGPRVGVGSAVVAPWGDLDLPVGHQDGATIQLGTLSVGGTGGPAVSMSERQGIAPRFDALRNSFDAIVAELRTRDGAPRAYFVAPAGGRNVQVTRIASDIGADVPAAASYCPSQIGALELRGGAPGSISGEGATAYGPGAAGIVAMPIDVEGDTISGPGRCLQFVAAGSVTDDVVRAQAFVAGTSGAQQRACGLSAGAEYRGSDGRRVAPLALAGMMRMDVHTLGSSALAGAPLTMRDGTSLELASTGDPVVAVLAHDHLGGEGEFGGPLRAHVLVVHPPYIHRAVVV